MQNQWRQCNSCNSVTASTLPQLILTTQILLLEYLTLFILVQSQPFKLTAEVWDFSAQIHSPTF